MLARRIARSSLATIRSASSQTPSISLQSQLLTRQFGTKLPVAQLSRRSVVNFVRSRWYSSEAAAKESESADAKASTNEAGSGEVEALKKDLEAKNKEVIDLKDKYLRSIADYRNLQDRTKREAQASRDFALQKFLRDLIGSVDNLDHALSSVASEKLAAPAADATIQTVHSDLKNLHQGLEMTEKILLDTLKKHGVTRFDPVAEGEKFDPNRHEAVFHAPMPGKADGEVFHTQQKGFILNGRVLRAAQVGVVNNPS